MSGVGKRMRDRWKKLLSGERMRPHSEPLSGVDGRGEFENDYTRVAFSSAVRRLQDKAQVFPLDKSDFVRTRLTHSLETSAIGRSIGLSVEEQLIQKYDWFREHKGKIPAILATVGLIHDLGNPPFGHFGEKVIRTFFKDLDCVKRLDPQQQADLQKFEGNAQTFRLLTRLQYLIDENGFNLTYGTLASQMKYPCSSLEVDPSRGVCRKKFGYFYSERERFRRVCQATEIGECRHPAAFLLEAADDIAYSAADIEDGLKKSVIDVQTIKRILIEEASNATDKDQALELIGSIDRYLAQVHKEFIDRDEIAVQRFRILAQGKMIEAVVEAFIRNHEAILGGAFTDELLDVSEAGWLRSAFKRLAAEFIFRNSAIIGRELTGQVVIEGLLKMFTDAVLSEDRKDTRTREGKLYSMISSNYRFICEQVGSGSAELTSCYDRLLLVTDYICGMTDSFALDLYRRLTGIALE